MTTKTLIKTNLTNPTNRPLRSIWSKTLTGLFWIAAISVVPATAAAVTTISQGYTTSDKVVAGSIVSLQNQTSDEVSAATTDNVGGLLGVVINDGNSLLTLSNGQSTQIQVATNGATDVLVSDIGGDIHSGDPITASPISGVGMVATSNIKIIGIAQGDLTKKNGDMQSYTDKSGQKHTVLLGQIPVLVGVSYYYRQPDKTIIPPALQNVANSLAGKKVNTLPIIISAVLFIVTLIVVVSIIYTMIRSSIISVGRNPMAQSAVYRDVIQLSALVVGILAVAVVSIYMVLTKL